jgi:hypothetical protein
MSSPYGKNSLETVMTTRQGGSSSAFIKKIDRARPKFVYIEPESSDDEAGGTFTANPAEDIPRNKLTEKLARGL